VSNGIAPSAWDHSVAFPIACAQGAVPPVVFEGTQFGSNIFSLYNYGTANQAVINWVCGIPSTSIPLASARFALAGAIPPSITLAAQSPFTTQYGQPIMYLFNGLGGQTSLAATVSASSVDSDGSSAAFPLPSSLAQSGYGFVTANETSSGSYQPNSFNLFSVASSQTVAGNPFGVSVGGQTDSYTICTPITIGPITHTQCSAISTYQTAPVVSLYSSNQVLVGGTAISVGANPTAVATYTSGSVSKTEGSVLHSFTGTTRAIVANSGSNSVSVLDIVNDALLYNVTVGNQPVALAVNTAGTAAYIANYKDSTVTEVNLTTGAAAGTVAVGGKPTSVALSAAGTLWVGGVGFLTEINASSLAVVSTESATGKTIVALGYSDQVGRLAATTVDGSGNVYVDEVSPSSVKAGGVYTPAASTSVSSLGTHLNTETKADVQSFTGTLASESIINTNQVGAPPLVVQDGWAVFTATPTGFSVSDISGNVVLFSEKTPSPVTAIAVDPSLNVAYLTMPDSNTILTVPLPGTGTN